jgi:hypothetical protein
MRPEFDRLVMAIAMNVHQHLEMNLVGIARLATGHTEKPKHIPQPARQRLTTLEFKDFTIAVGATGTLNPAW